MDPVFPCVILAFYGKTVKGATINGCKSRSVIQRNMERVTRAVVGG